MNKLLKLTTTIGFTAVALVTVFSVLGFPKHLRLFVVQSGSMSPAITVGSIVAVKPADAYKVGDVITFKTTQEADEKNPKHLITHRITEITQGEDGNKLFTTKGDANQGPDLTKVEPELILGRVVFDIPYLGYPVGFAKTQTGYMLLIVIPATVIVYSELINIRSEARKLMAQRKHKRNLTLREKVELAVGQEEIKMEKGIMKFLYQQKT